MKRLVLIFGAFAIASACGSDSPSAPSQPAVAQVGGVWRGNFTTVSVTGGECFAGVLQSTIGGRMPRPRVSPKPGRQSMQRSL